MLHARCEYDDCAEKTTQAGKTGRTFSKAGACGREWHRLMTVVMVMLVVLFIMNEGVRTFP
eukprot:300280-Pleurochrysis_carterae.AAC.1